MPYLVQTLHASAISALYRPLEEMLEFTIHATIAKGTINIHDTLGKNSIRYEWCISHLLNFILNLYLFILQHLIKLVLEANIMATPPTFFF